MEQAKTREPSLLGAVYRNAREAGEELLSVLPRVEDEALKHDVTVAVGVYGAYVSRASRLLAEAEEPPQEAGWMEQFGKRMRTWCVSDAAEMLAEDAERRADAMQARIRALEGARADAESLELARQLYAYECEHAEQMRTHIK